MDLQLLKFSSWILGIAPFASPARRVYSLVLFTVIAASSFNVLRLAGDASSSLHGVTVCSRDINLSVGILFDVIARSARVISYIIMHTLSYKNEDKFQNLYTNLTSVRHKLLNGNISQSKRPVLFIAIFTFVRIFITLYRLFIIDEKSGGIVTILSIPYHLKFIFNILMELQLFTLCSDLEQSFEAVNKRLLQLRKHSPSNALTPSGRVLVDKWWLPVGSQQITSAVLIPYPAAVRSLRRTHAILCDMVNQVNNLFGTRLLVDITAQLIALMLRLKLLVSWLFDALNTATEPPSAMASRVQLNSAVSALLLCPIHIGTVFAVVFFCARTMHKTEQTAAEIHAILNRSLERESREELQMFTMQLMQRRVQFTAAGVFPLDFSLLYSFMGVVTTYLVILVQFGASLPRFSMENASCESCQKSCTFLNESTVNGT